MAIKGSKNVRARVWQAVSQFMLAGSHGLPTSASTRTVILPPGVGLAAAVVVVPAVVAVVAEPPVVVAPPPDVVAVPPPVVVGLLPELSPPHAAATRPMANKLTAMSWPGRLVIRRGECCTL